MPTIPYLKTPAVARLLGVPYPRVMALIRWEYIPAGQGQQRRLRLAAGGR